MAIRTASDRVLARVEFVTQPKQGEFGEFCSVLFLRIDLEGEQAKIWKSFKPADASKFFRDQQVWLVPAQRKGKDTWDIELIDASAPLPTAEAPGRYHVTRQPAVEPAQLTPEQKRQIAQYVATRSDLIGFCFQTVHEKFAALDNNAQTAAAIELYRSACSKFDL